jgi:PAS domain S-box-containing protein
MMSTDEVTEKANTTSAGLTPLHAAIAILAADRTVLCWNQRAESLTGYSLEALGRLDLIGAFEPAEMMHRVLLRVHAGEFPVNERLHLRTADGRRLPVEVQCAPLRSLDCSETRLVLVIREVAPLLAWSHSQARLPVLGRLAGTLSHEIRNPMNAIFLHTDIMEEEMRQLTPSDSAQVMQSLATVKAEVIRLHALMQDYLCLARLSDLQPVPVDLRTLIEDLVSEMSPQWLVRGVTVVTHGLDDLGEVVLHQSLFRRALLNILQLLIEAMPPDSNLTLSSGHTGCRVHLHIRDLGKVIPPEVWAAFQTPLRAKAPEVADLRWYVAQEIITAHGGEMAVSEMPETGMRCTITLPQARRHSDDKPAPEISAE